LRYFIKFAYKGTNYHGWQIQPNAITVQEILNKALSVIVNSPIDTVGAGRTDTGVHAKEMYAHFDFDGVLDNHTIIHKLNSYLPQDIAVLDIIAVRDDAHARFDAKLRTYEYHIHNFKDVFLKELSWYYNQPLDVSEMNKAAFVMMSYNDFECFSKVNTDVNTFTCQIQQAKWEYIGSRLIFTIAADRFLRNMVRAIVGTLVNVGLNKTSLSEFKEILESRDRKRAGLSVPAHGLYLTKINYDYIMEKSSPDRSGILFPDLARNEAILGKRYSG